MKNKLTREDLVAQIDKVEYSRVGVKTTICTATLKNGFEIIGTSACVDPANFDEKIGQECAYEQVIEKLWELEGYRLQSALAGGSESSKGGSEFEKLAALRASLLANIQLADNKAFGLLQVNTDSVMLKDLCLEVVYPNLEVGEAPEGYEIYNNTEIEHLRHECNVLREIVLYKYKKVQEMINFLRS